MGSQLCFKHQVPQKLNPIANTLTGKEQLDHV